MHDVLKDIQSGKIIDQEYYELAMQRAYEKLIDPTEQQKVEYHHEVYGGNCPICLKPWIKRDMKNKICNYYYYKADCECYKQELIDYEHEKELSAIAERSGVPVKYINCSVKEMDKKTIKPITAETIKYVEEYIKKKVFDKGIVIYGSPGTGKTHLSVAILKAVAYIKQWSAIYVKMSSFIDNVRLVDGFIKDILKHKIILLNDIDKSTIGNKTDSTWVNDKMFELFEGINEDNRLLIATTNICDINKLYELFDPTIISRILSSCYTVKIEGDDYRLNKTYDHNNKFKEII